MKVKIESEATQLCLTLSDPMDCSLPGSAVHGIFQARVLEWVAIAFPKKQKQTQTNKLEGTNRCITEAEEWISELEDRIVENN